MFSLRPAYFFDFVIVMPNHTTLKASIVLLIHAIIIIIIIIIIIMTIVIMIYFQKKIGHIHIYNYGSSIPLNKIKS